MSKRDYKSYNILDPEIEKKSDLHSEINDINMKKEDVKLAIQEEKNNSVKNLEVQQRNMKEIGNESKWSNIYAHEITRQDLTKQAITEKMKSEGINQQGLEGTSFSSYKYSYQNKERSFISKWIIRIAKGILGAMLLPLIGVVGVALITVIGAFIVGIIGSIGLGATIIAVTSFFSTQISGILVALGVSTSITMLSFGAILTILFIMIVKSIWAKISRRKMKKALVSREEN